VRSRLGVDTGLDIGLDLDLGLAGAHRRVGTYPRPTRRESIDSDGLARAVVARTAVRYARARVANQTAVTVERARPRGCCAVPLARREDLGAGYHVLLFDARAAPLVVHAGQFAMVHAPGWGSEPLLPRPMSLLDVGEEPSILIKVVGEGTRRMASAAPGAVFRLHAPLGRPWGPPDGALPVLVAGGVGVAPLVLLAEEIAASGGVRPLALYGGRSARDLPLADRLAASCAELRVATEDGSHGRRGLVTALLTEALATLAPERVRIYTCGPHGMMAAVARIAAGAAVACEASLEAPMACGYGVCLGCAVARSAGGYLYACVDGPCVDARIVDWSRGPFG
jgi:dihydroorotate dehydrogenase electron transfer subunit